MQISFTIPGIPPSVNHYVRHSGGRHFKSGKSERWMQTVSAVARGKSVRGDAKAASDRQYRVEAVFFFGKGQRNDVDNLGKLLLDSLVVAGVIHTDASVTEIEFKKRRDWNNSRTEITVKVLEAA